MFKKVIYNTFAQILGKGATATSSLIVTILIGKSLGPTGYGEYTKIFVFVGYFYTLVDFGLNAIIVRLMQKADEIVLLRRLLATRLVLAFLFTATAIIITFFLPYNAVTQTGFSPLVRLGIILASATIITQALYTSFNTYFQKNLRYDLSTLAAVTSAIIVLAFALFAFWRHASVLGFTAAYVFGGIGLVTVAAYIFYRRTKSPPLPDFTNIKKHLDVFKESWPVGLALLLNLIYFRVDVFILSQVKPNRDVGIYGLAYQFFETSLSLPIFFANGIYPHFLKVHSEEPKNLKQTVWFWSITLILVSLVLVVFLYFISFIIPLYDSRFAASSAPLRVLALGMPFFFLSAVLWHLLIIYKKQKFLTLIYAAGALTNIVLNLIYIPKYGYMAAAVITVISEALILFLLLAILNFLRGKND